MASICDQTTNNLLAFELCESNTNKSKNYAASRTLMTNAIGVGKDDHLESPYCL